MIINLWSDFLFPLLIVFISYIGFVFLSMLQHYIDGKKDGLTRPWEILNWCNPPFNQCDKWVKKAYLEQKKGNETVMLIPVRTETKYWHDYILFNKNVEIHWLKKGYAFIDPDTNKLMGVFKNALALVFFNNGENKC